MMCLGGTFLSKFLVLDTRTLLAAGFPSPMHQVVFPIMKAYPAEPSHRLRAFRILTFLALVLAFFFLFRETSFVELEISIRAMLPITSARRTARGGA